MSVSSPITSWFRARGWRLLPFQRETWEAYARGESGLVHAPTGLGKTLAAWIGPIREELQSGTEERAMRVLWITPMRALATDTARSLQQALDGVGLQRRAECRTGDTSSSVRVRQKRMPPFALVTTPESLSLILTDEEQLPVLRGLRAVVVDEWHELLGSKRGVQTQLCMARLRTLAPGLKVWGLSATIGNLDEAMRVLLGRDAAQGRIVHGRDRKVIKVETLLPKEMETFPWSGHIGVKLVQQVAERIANARTTLLFTNTRSQTEIWYQELLDACPDWKDQLAMHHSSIDREDREAVEQRLRDGTVKCVVCTSSLDLGVDFSPVEQVMQVGSPKGIARLLQRAGRSGHQPGAVSRVLGVPTNALELVEFAAARESLAARRIESRHPVMAPLDLLAQHLITVALGGGFREEEMLAEVRSTHSYANLTDDEWKWTLRFITTGGALHAYPQYHKVTLGEDGVYRLTDERMARMHRFSIGTIVAGASVSIQLRSGRRLGSVEEWFISHIQPGRCFIFGGKVWELVRFHNLVAQVKPPEKKKPKGQIPSWQGGKSPLSSELSAAVADKLRRFRAGEPDKSPEMKKITPVLEVQRRWSIIPNPDEMLIEQLQTRDGYHVYLYPFAGRLVNAAIGTLTGYRIGRDNPLSLIVTPNDYGVELYGTVPLEVSESEWRAILSPDHLLDDVLASVNAAELGRHHFREIARVAGLILTGTPGSPPTMKMLQTSSGLLYDVFTKYDPDNLLLSQARREVLERQLEFTRLRETLQAMTRRKIICRRCERLTPLAFPLWSDRISTHLATEDASTRLARMLEELERAAQKDKA
ncbi:MAG TPA: ligase-associated DNA damage response DEXH box helicase [Verrucomicrobiales bacterium]|nr:ligase-associated DNA damage response DEXH box helicase [Verrucomicrobiales bacterium]